MLSHSGEKAQQGQKLKKKTKNITEILHARISVYSKTGVKRPLSKRQKLGFQYQLSLNVGHTYCRMLQGEHSAILSTFIKLTFVIKIFILPIFE